MSAFSEREQFFRSGQVASRCLAARKLQEWQILDRELRQVRAKVIPNVKREVLPNEILKNVEKKARIYTDGWASYDDLKTKDSCMRL